MYCMENFFTFPGKTEFALKFSLYWIHFLTFRIFEQLALDRVCPENFHCSGYAFGFRIFEQLALALKKTAIPEFFHCIEYIFFIIQDLWATCACPEKQSCPENFHCIEIFFYHISGFLSNLRLHSGFLSNLRLPWKRQCALNFFTALNIHFLSFRIFEQLALALNSLYWMYIFFHSGFLSNLRLPLKRELPWDFSLYWNIFYPAGFWATCACPDNRVCPEFTVLNVYFFSFTIFEQLALSLKKRVALKFFTVLKYFLSFRSFEQLSLPLKFFKTGVGVATHPRPPPRTPMCVPQVQYNLELLHSQESCVPHLEMHSRQLSLFQTRFDQSLHGLIACWFGVQEDTFFELCLA